MQKSVNVHGSIRYVISALLVVFAFYCFIPDAFPLFAFKRTFAANEILKGAGNTYQVPKVFGRIYLLPVIADGPTTGQFASNLELFENGKPLGPAHAHAFDVSTMGAGRYIHWGSTDSALLFSTSDNSDPRTNGRTYSVRAYPQIPVALFVIVALPLFVFLICRLIPDGWMPAVQGAICLSLFLLWAHVTWGFVAYFFDSSTYYKGLTIVPLGYHYFLQLFPSLTWVPVAQLALLCASIFFLAIAINRFSRTAGLGTILILAVNASFFYAHAGMLSEGLMVPTIIANVAAAIFVITDHRRRWAILVALTAALIMFIRPAGYFAPLGVIFLCLALPGRRVWAVKWALIPLVLFIGATFAINYAVRGGATQSQIGRVLFPHVAFIFEPEFSSGEDRDLAGVILETLKPHREKYSKATSLTERFVVSADDYNLRLSATDLALRKEYVRLNKEDGYLQRMDALYVRLFLRTIVNRPLEYLGIVRDQVVGAWENLIMYLRAPTAVTLKDEFKHIGWRTETAKDWSVPLRAEALTPDLSRFDGIADAIVTLLEKIYKRIQSQRELFYLIGVASGLAMILAVFLTLPLRWLALGYCGVIIHGSILLTSATTVFIQRYALPVDPIVLVAGVILVDGVIAFAAMLLRLSRFRIRTA